MFRTKLNQVKRASRKRHLANGIFGSKNAIYKA